MQTRRNNYTDDDPCAESRKSEGGGKNPTRIYIYACISDLLRIVSCKYSGSMRFLSLFLKVFRLKVKNMELDIFDRLRKKKESIQFVLRDLFLEVAAAATSASCASVLSS